MATLTQNINWEMWTPCGLLHVMLHDSPNLSLWHINADHTNSSVWLPVLMTRNLWQAPGLSRWPSLFRQVDYRISSALWQYRVPAPLSRPSARTRQKQLTFRNRNRQFIWHTVTESQMHFTIHSWYYRYLKWLKAEPATSFPKTAHWTSTGLPSRTSYHSALCSSVIFL